MSMKMCGDPGAKSQAKTITKGIEVEKLVRFSGRACDAEGNDHH